MGSDALNTAKEIERLHRTARWAIIAVVLCTAIMASITIHFGRKLQSITAAQEQLDNSRRVNEVIKQRAYAILPKIESLRVINESTGEPDPRLADMYDRIEADVRDIMERRYGSFIGSTTTRTGGHP